MFRNSLRLIVIFFLLFSQNLYSQELSSFEKKYEKKIVPAYQKGKYNKTIRKSRRVLKKIRKKGLIEKEVVCKASGIQLLALEKSGHTKRSVEYLENLKSLNTIDPACRDFFIAEYFYIKGDLEEGNIYLEKALGSFNPTTYNDSLFYYNMELALTGSLIEQGYFFRARKKLDLVIPSLEARNVKKIPAEEGSKKPYRKLPGRKVKERKEQLASAYLLESELALTAGDVLLFDSLAQRNGKWIKKSLSTRNINYIFHLNQLAARERITGNLKLAFKYQEKAAGKTKNPISGPGYRKTNPYHLEEMENYIHDLVLMDKKQLVYRKLRIYFRFTAKLGKFQTKNHLAYLRSNVKKWILKQDYKNAGEKVQFIDTLTSHVLDEKHLREYIPTEEVRYNYFLKTNQFKKADASMDHITRLYANNYGIDAPGYALARIRKANHNTNFSFEVMKAKDILMGRDWKIFSRYYHPYHPDYLQALNNRGLIFSLTDKYDSAQLNYNQAKDLAAQKFGNESEEYGIQVILLASLKLNQGNYSEASALISQAKEIIRKSSGTASAAYAKALEAESELLVSTGDYDAGLSQLEKSLDITEKSKRKYENVQLINFDKLAAIYVNTGNYEKAGELLERSLVNKEREFGDEHFQLIQPLYNLGKVKLATGDYIQAEKLTRRALEVTGKILGEQSLQYLDILKQLGEVYMAIGDYEKAESFIARAIAKQKELLGPRHPDLGKSYINYSLISYYNGKPIGESKQYLEKGREIILEKMGEKHLLNAESLKILAQFEEENKNFNEASSLLAQAEGIVESSIGKVNDRTAQLKLIQGDVKKEQEDYKGAEKKYKQGLKYYKKIFGKNHPKYVQALSKIARVKYLRGQTTKAAKLVDETNQYYLVFIDKYFPFLSEKEKMNYWSLLQNDFEFFYTIAFELYEKKPKLLQKAYDFRLETKALLLNSSIQIKKKILEGDDEGLKIKFSEWNEKKELMAKVLAMPESKLKQMDLDPEELQSEINLLEKELSESSRVFAEEIKDRKLTWKLIRDSLEDKEMAVEVIRFKKYGGSGHDSVKYAFLMVSRETKKNPEIVIIKNGNLLEDRYINYYRNAIKLKAQDKYSYNAFWEKADQKVPEGYTIYFSPDGVYNQLNLETLSPDGKTYIIDKNEIILVSNTKEVLQKDRKIKSKMSMDAFLAGNPNFFKKPNGENGNVNGKNLPTPIYPLPGAEDEIKKINTILKRKGWVTQVLLEKQAEEEMIKSLSGPNILHLATHGYFSNSQEIIEAQGLKGTKSIQNPLLRSGLLFAGAGEILTEDGELYVNSRSGILTAYEAMNLNLSKTDLVILSACETGLGEVRNGEGVYGLQRAFLVAGAKSVIMTLFKVSDEVTMELMTYFYEYWLASGNKREAFKKAKLKIKETHPEPIYWGAFVMMGIN